METEIFSFSFGDVLKWVSKEELYNYIHVTESLKYHSEVYDEFAQKQNYRKKTFIKYIRLFSEMFMYPGQKIYVVT